MKKLQLPNFLFLMSQKMYGLTTLNDHFCVAKEFQASEHRTFSLFRKSIMQSYYMQSYYDGKWDKKLAKKFITKIQLQEEIEKDEKSFKESPVKWLNGEGNICSVDKVLGKKPDSKNKQPDSRNKQPEKQAPTLRSIWTDLYDDPSNSKKQINDSKESSYNKSLSDGYVQLNLDAPRKPNKEKPTEIDDDRLYVMLVCGILKEAKKPFDLYDEKESKKGKYCHPMVIAAALVTEDHLKGAENPMNVALMVRAAIRNIWGKRSSEILPNLLRSNILYSNIYEEDIRNIPRDFAEGLLKECVTLNETRALIDVTDVKVLYALAEGRFRRVTQDYAFKKVTREIFWASIPSDSFWKFCLSVLQRLLLIIYGNILYFVEIITFGKVKISSCCCCKEVEVRKQFFSPVSCHIADIVNLLIIVALISTVLHQKGTSSAQERTLDQLVRQYREGKISIEDDPRLKNGSTPEITQVELEKDPFSTAGFTLLFCFVSRLMTIILKFSKKMNNFFSTAFVRAVGTRTLRCFTKFKYYNFAILFLFIALSIDLCSSYSESIVYGKFENRSRPVNECDHEIGKLIFSRDPDFEATKDKTNTLEMISCCIYSAAFFMYATMLFYDSLRFFSIIGRVCIIGPIFFIADNR